MNLIHPKENIVEYRHLGKAGIKVSQLSFGSWVTFGKQMDISLVKECIKYSFDNGINFFDNAEVYAAGASEELMGEAFRQLGIPRHHYVLTTKFFWGIENLVNFKNTLNRKYLMHAMQESLKRWKMDFVDIVYCHRPDPETPIEEIVMAMHDIIQRGYALYWGTSEWTAIKIEQAFDFAVANGFHRPMVEQPQYNMIHNHKVEKEFAPLYKKMGLGLTIWSPLASGLLTGKYLNEIPQDSRLNMKSMSWLQDELQNPKIRQATQELQKISNETRIPMSQLAIGWCTLNPNVSTVILGASRLTQLKENLESLNVINQIRDVKKNLDAIASITGL
jgi:voltage-dependent potassium channel beta subunit